MRTRIGIAAMVFMMVQAVLFGVGALLVLATPLSADAVKLMPVVILGSFLLSAPFSWWLAPRLRARYWRHSEPSAADRTLAALS